MDEPRTLKSVFAEAEEKRHALDNTYEAASPQYREDLSAAIDDYLECLQLIGSLSIFSPNESLEDISTSDLPYLLINFYLAELTQKISATSPHERKKVLERARDAYERFLHMLDSYSLLSPSYAKLLESYADDPGSFSTVSTSDPNARRNAKIANFKAEKELRQKLEYLRRRPEYLEDGGGGGDEEAVREVHVANVHYCAHMTFQALESLNREFEILAQAPVPLLPQTSSVEEDERRRADSMQEDGFSDRLDRPLRRLGSLSGNGPLLAKDGKPLRPFTLLGNRQEIQRGVFRPSHNLPTMTIDEYLDEERRRGGIIEGGGEASGRQPTPDEDNYEKADAETMKAREWDEFTEANPKGSGNTLNRG
ncbi:putative type 2a phosphatase-associated protein 42 protein [Phaeoacremonium minimum UCRPA7]|uniref:Putative type 2a phosphatase-associated protein 42 protein n=1 Tax=Phaeoacremonium minimum (strain UCR-PA7) TaxID=1286976 RepID=R8BB80_PHAM7|nr:putative type 2a phosphatase-associated protein 42 protein [Phaeoacremonium minimum UCRPA7]EON96542.1 putative type 2a phosphatase-associated protein 42 protein [Phaeoacremonium minimum UCRPA7]